MFSEILRPPQQPYTTNLGSVPVPNLRKAHDVHVLGVLTKGTESLVSSMLSTAASAFDTPSDTELMALGKGLKDRVKEAQTSTLSGRASVRARGREPDVTGAPVQIIAPAWESATKQRASANVTCNPRVRLQQETTVTFLKPISKVVTVSFSSASAGLFSAALEPSPFMMLASTSPLQNNRSSCSTSAQRHGGEPTWRFDLPS